MQNSSSVNQVILSVAQMTHLIQLPTMQWKHSTFYRNSSKFAVDCSQFNEKQFNRKSWFHALVSWQWYLTKLQSSIGLCMRHIFTCYEHLCWSRAWFPRIASFRQCLASVPMTSDWCSRHKNSGPTLSLPISLNWRFFPMLPVSFYI